MSARRGNGEGSIYRRKDGRGAAACTLESGQRKTLYGRTRGDVAQRLWQRAVGSDVQATAAAQDMARGALNLCQFAVEIRGIAESKGCLQQHHDKFGDYLNANYWKAVGAGT